MAGRRAIDETGHRYGRLTVLQRTKNKVRSTTGDNPQEVAAWLCLCDCGGLVTVSGCRLRRGVVRSCGCIRRENGREQIIGYKFRERERKKHCNEEKGVED